MANIVGLSYYIPAIVTVVGGGYMVVTVALTILALKLFIVIIGTKVVAKKCLAKTIRKLAIVVMLHWAWTLKLGGKKLKFRKIISIWAPKIKVCKGKKHCP